MQVVLYQFPMGKVKLQHYISDVENGIDILYQFPMGKVMFHNYVVIGV